jgi:hypothetical protein
MTVIYSNHTRLPAALERALDVSCRPLDVLLADSDFVSVHASNIGPNEQLIGRAAFALFDALAAGMTRQGGGKRRVVMAIDFRDPGRSLRDLTGARSGPPAPAQLPAERHGFKPHSRRKQPASDSPMAIGRVAQGRRSGSLAASLTWQSNP